MSPPGSMYLQEHGVPVYSFPEQTSPRPSGRSTATPNGSTARSWRPIKFDHDKAAAREIIESSLAAGKTYLGELAGVHLLKAYGFNVLPTVLAKTAADAVKEADAMGYPVVLKIVSEQIIHKSDAGGVKINLADAGAVEHAFGEITAGAEAYNPDAVIDGVLCRRWHPKGRR